MADAAVSSDVGANVVYTFKAVTLEITGPAGVWRPPVASLTIELVESGIPRIIATVDPTHEAAQPDDSHIEDLGFVHVGMSLMVTLQVR